MSLVNPGVGETRANPCSPASRFRSEDLPTFERPMKANSGSDSSGHEFKSGALQSKTADEMFTMESPQPIVAQIHRIGTYISRKLMQPEPLAAVQSCFPNPRWATRSLFLRSRQAALFSASRR